MLNRVNLCAAIFAPMLMVHFQEADCCIDLRAVVLQQSSELQKIAEWTAVQSGLRATTSLPRLELRSPAELAAIRYGGSPVQMGADIIALYDPASRTILLSKNWQGTKTAAFSVIVHEMVHHLQQENGKRYGCVQEQEEQAFAAQDAWLAENGSSLEKEFGIDPFTRLVASLCPY